MAYTVLGTIAYLTLETGFLDPALDAGFFTVEAGFADARDDGLAAFDVGFSDVVLEAGLEAGLVADALDSGGAAAFEAGLESGLA